MKKFLAVLVAATTILALAGCGAKKPTDNNATSDRWLTSASYFVFKNLTLSYDIPKTIINSWGIEGVTLTFGAENLWTHTSRKGLNPQYSFNGGYDDTYVTARVINFGLAVNF